MLPNIGKGEKDFTRVATVSRSCTEEETFPNYCRASMGGFSIVAMALACPHCKDAEGVGLCSTSQCPMTLEFLTGKMFSFDNPWLATKAMGHLSVTIMVI